MWVYISSFLCSYIFHGPPEFFNFERVIYLVSCFFPPVKQMWLSVYICGGKYWLLWPYCLKYTDLTASYHCLFSSPSLCHPMTASYSISSITTLVFRSPFKMIKSFPGLFLRMDFSHIKPVFKIFCDIFSGYVTLDNINCNPFLALIILES